MRIFLDTSVLVSGFFVTHQHHAASLAAMERFQKRDAALGGHSLAEVYASLTGMPGQARVRPEAALLYLRSLQENFTLTALTPVEYGEALQSAVQNHVSGGGIYDALLAACALKVAAETICTWNIADFARCGPAVAARLKRPDQLI
ncbi:MAG: PIN domain-containing protein [Terriglobales bacterium]